MDLTTRQWSRRRVTREAATSLKPNLHVAFATSRSLPSRRGRARLQKLWPLQHPIIARLLALKHRPLLPHFLVGHKARVQPSSRKYPPPWPCARVHPNLEIQVGATPEGLGFLHSLEGKPSQARPAHPFTRIAPVHVLGSECHSGHHAPGRGTYFNNRSLGAGRRVESGPCADGSCVSWSMRPMTSTATSNSSVDIASKSPLRSAAVARSGKRDERCVRVTMFLLAALLLPAATDPPVEAPLPKDVAPMDEPGRYRSSRSLDETLDFYQREFRRVGGIRWNNIVNLPGIKAKNITCLRKKTKWEGINIYETHGEVRLYVIPREVELATDKKAAAASEKKK